MRRSNAAIMLIAFSMLLPIAVLADDGKIPATDSVTGSRWARVDLTQYCGRTVGELLDTLGNDYKDCRCGGEPLWGSGCTFVYDDGVIQLAPCAYQYIHPDRNDYKYYDPSIDGGPWNLDEFKKETIGHMTLIITPPAAGPVSRIGFGRNRQRGFGIDYASYIGTTIDSMVNDIGWPVMFSMAYSAYGEYKACVLKYPNHITIEAKLESDVPIPAGVTNRLLITNYLLRQRLGDLQIDVGSSGQGERDRGGEREGTRGVLRCDATIGIDDTSDIAGNRQESARGSEGEGHMQSLIKRHTDKIKELIRKTAEYNRNHGTSWIGTLVITRVSDGYNYIYDIGGNYYETGVRLNMYASNTKIVAIVHTHAECAGPTPADIYAFARGAHGPVVIIVGTNDNSLSVMRYSDVKTARSYASYNSQAAIADKCRDPLDPTPPCDRRLELIRKFFDTENTGIDYIHITDWREWIK